MDEPFAVVLPDGRITLNVKATERRRVLLETSGTGYWEGPQGQPWVLLPPGAHRMPSILQEWLQPCYRDCFEESFVKRIEG
jgi:hypothetical protein